MSAPLPPHLNEARDIVAALSASRALQGRKGHGGASSTYRVMRPRDLEKFAAEAFEAGAREALRRPPASEAYPKDWARVTLMVSPAGEMHAIDGDRAPGDPQADLPYIGLDRIHARMRSLITTITHEQAVQYTCELPGKDWHLLRPPERMVVEQLMQNGYLSPVVNGFVGQAITPPYRPSTGKHPLVEEVARHLNDTARLIRIINEVALNNVLLYKDASIGSYVITKVSSHPSTVNGINLYQRRRIVACRTAEELRAATMLMKQAPDYSPTLWMQGWAKVWQKFDDGSKEVKFGEGDGPDRSDAKTSRSEGPGK